MSAVLSSGRGRASAAIAIPHAPLRVVLNGRFLTQQATGVQRYARETVLALDRLLERDADLRARVAPELAVPRGAAPLPLEHIGMRVVPRLRGHLWEQLALPAAARGAYLVNFGYSGPIAKRRQLITLHDAAVRAVTHSYTWRYRLLHESLVRLLARRVDTVMTVSRFSRAELARRYDIRCGLLGTEGWQHAVAHAGADATLAKFGLPAHRYLLAIAGPAPHKNLALIERALARLDAFPFTCAIVGAPPPRVLRVQPAAGAGVRLLGYVSDAELSQLYRNAAWLVLPSLYEGFGLPAIEAMGNGCPVLAARAGALPEVCGSAALYFDPRDPGSLAALLRRVAAEPALRPAMAARAFARLKRFSWDANARVLADHLLAQARGQRTGVVT